MKQEATPTLQGIFASDMDGTLSFRGEPIDRPIIDMLLDLSHQGWKLLFVTGRTLTWSLQHLSSVSVPHYIAPFNGASLWQVMPDGTVEKLSSRSIGRSVLEKLFPWMIAWGAVMYEAPPSERIFVLKAPFPKGVWDHLMIRKKLQKEEWIELFDLESLPEDLHEMAAVRFFFNAHDLEAGRALVPPGVVCSWMKDSLSAAFRILQVTAEGATKRNPLVELKKRYRGVPTVAIGDDVNDIPMLREAEYSLAIDGSEQSVLDAADDVTQGTSPEEIVASIYHMIRKRE